MKQPILDVPTRWSSSFKMLERLLELKNFCQESEEENQDFHLPQKTWASISLLCEALQPINEATINFQSEQLTLSDFYGQWLRCKSKINSIDSTFAKKLVEQITKRESKVFTNIVLISCVFLDPRFVFFLSEEEKERAQSHIKKLWLALMDIKSRNKENENSDQNVNALQTVNTDLDEEVQIVDHTEDEFEKMLEIEDKKRRLSSIQIQTDAMNIDEDLYEYSKIVDGPRLPSTTSILKYWKDFKDSPALKEVAQTIMAVPATQVSVERLFSNLAFIYNPLRSNLNETVLENIVLLRSNFNFISKNN